MAPGEFGGDRVEPAYLPYACKIVQISNKQVTYIPSIIKLFKHNTVFILA
jgi:hypothetical protein